MTPTQREDITRLVTEVLAVHGGLNDRSTRALLEVARLHGLDAHQILRILEQVAHHEHDATILTVTRAAQCDEAPDETNPARSGDKAIDDVTPARFALPIITTVLYAASVVLILLTIIAVTREPAPIDASERRVVRPDPKMTSAPTTGTLEIEREDTSDVASDPTAFTYDELLGPFDEAPERFREVGGEALPPIARAIEHISETWTALDRATVEGSANRIARLVIVLQEGGYDEAYAHRVLDVALLPSSGVSDREGANAALAPRRIAPTIWSIGMATRLSKETHPAPQIRSRLETHLRSVFGRRGLPYRPSFRDGATSATVLLAMRMVDASSAPFADVDESSWDEIRRVFLALKGFRQRTTDTAILELLTYILRVSGDPSSSSFAGKGISTLISLIDWSQRESGQALLAWFDDSEIPTPNLATAMKIITNTSRTMDLTSATLLTRAAPPIQRARVRDQIAELYALPASSGDGWVEHTWAPALARALSETPDSSDTVASLARAATFARLSAASSLRWEGELPMAEQEIKAAFDAVADARRWTINNPASETDPSLLTSPASPSDGRFARAYLNAGRSTENRLEAIQAHASRPTPIEPADADVLAQAAFYAVPVEVRRAAQQAALAHDDSIAMTHAILESLPDAPSIDLTNEFLSTFLGVTLRDPDDPDWPLEVRRAVLAKLNEQIAAKRRPLVGALAQDLDRTTRLRARGATGPPDDPNPLRLFRKRLDLASQFVDAPIRANAPNRVRLRYTRRVSIADGPIQRFHAHQLSSFELFAYAVAAERPSAEDRVRSIIDDLEHERDGAAHVFSQIESTERALARLWAVRLDVEESLATPEGAIP